MSAKIRQTDVTAERVHPSGAWSLHATDDDGYPVRRQYMGYTKRQALRLFVDEMNGDA